LQVVIRNDSSVTVSGVRVIVGRRTGFGMREDAAFRLRRALRPGQRISLQTNLGPLNAKQAGQFATAITGARVSK
ncbi:MAG: hypothetical protein HKP55_15240, partial [Gammaproteobacteria bacterium]|nr:hypothetical protein [Gammaproteobacteria bacterium]